MRERLRVTISPEVKYKQLRDGIQQKQEANSKQIAQAVLSIQEALKQRETLGDDFAELESAVVEIQAQRDSAKDHYNIGQAQAAEREQELREENRNLRYVIATLFGIVCFLTLVFIGLLRMKEPLHTPPSKSAPIERKTAQDADTFYPSAVKLPSK